VTQEVLRISPITFFAIPRILKAPLEIQGVTYPSGCALIPAIYLVHHHPDIYPQPEQFRPERFLERQFSPYEFLPFGGGHRFCLGMAVAQLQIKLVLAELVQKFSVRVLQPELVKPSWRLITFAPPDGMRAELSPC
jgi:cytochrome P450 family 110